MHDDAYIGGRSENNIKCVVHDVPMFCLLVEGECQILVF